MSFRTAWFGLILVCLTSFRPSLAQGIDSFISKQIQDQVTRQVSAGISKTLSENLLIPLLKIRNESGEVKDFTLSGDQRYYNLLHRDGTVRVWDSKLGVQRPAIRPEGKRFSRVVSDSASGTVLVGAEDGKVYVFDILTARPLGQLDSGAGEEVAAMSLSEMSHKLAVAHRDGAVVVWDSNSLQKIASLDTKHDAGPSRLLISDQDKTLIIAGEGGFVEVWDWELRRKMASLPKQSGEPMGLWANNRIGLIYLDAEGNLQWLEQPDYRPRINKKLDGGGALVSVAVSFDARLLASSTEDRQIKLFNLDNLATVKSIKTQENLSHLQFINRGRQLVGADQKGILHVWDTASAAELLQLISTDTGWTVVDNQGRFDSSEGGMPNVSWQAADRDIPIDSFSAHYYEPGLLATHLNNDVFINPQPRTVQAGITLPPEIGNLQATGTAAAGDEVDVSFEIVDAGGGIGEHRFYHNGKIVDKSAEKNVLDTETNGKLYRKVTYNVEITPGLNKFKAIAANQMGIDSQAQLQSLQTAEGRARPKLHVLAVGIDKYDDSKLNLAYSVADAQAIAMTLSDKAKPVFEEVSAYGLLDDGATKNAIFEKLSQISEDSLNDVLVVYLAGHGIAVNGDWYFLPHETTFQANEQYITRVGISAKQIQALLAKIPAQKILVLIDSCYAGAGIQALGNLQNSQRHFSRALSKTVGVVVLAATRQDQQALELAELGHGLFTYVVNTGMQGAADLHPRDQRVSAYEVANYSMSTIPVFAKKYTGASQEPTAFTIGEDFILLAR